MRDELGVATEGPLRDELGVVAEGPRDELGVATEGPARDELGVAADGPRDELVSILADGPDEKFTAELLYEFTEAVSNLSFISCILLFILSISLITKGTSKLGIDTLTVGTLIAVGLGLSSPSSKFLL